MKQRWIGTGIALILLYLLLALGVHADWFISFDRVTTTVLQDAIPRWLDLPFSVLSLLGSFELTSLFFVLLAFWFFRPRDALVLIALFLLIVAVEGLGKELIHQPGPGKALHRYVFALSLPTGNVHTPYSFPSGHAARAAFLGVVLGWVILNSPARPSSKQVLLLLLLACEVVMMVSRVYLGEHWTTDVVGGIVLGALLALPALSMAARFDRLERGWTRLRSRAGERAP